MTRGACLVVVLGLAVCAAQAQPVTLKVDDAGLWEVAAALSKQTGAAIDLPFAAGAPDEPHVTLDVKDLALRAVLRLIGEQTGGHFESWERGDYYYTQEPDPLAEAPTAKTGPYLVRIGSVRIEDARELRFRTDFDEPLEITHHMLVRFSLDADDELDLARLVGLAEEVRAVDNTGRRITVVEPAETEWEGFESPGGWWGTEPELRLTQPAAEAAGLASLEGALVAYRQARWVKLRVPLPPPATPTVTEVCSLLVTHASMADEGYTVRGTLTPVGDGWGPVDPDMDARLEFANGGVARGYETEASVEWGNGATPGRGQYTWLFQDLPAGQPVAFVCDLVAVTPDTEVVPFRFQNIPLPTWEAN